MPQSLESRGVWSEVQGLNGRIKVIPLRFTTDASGDETLAYSYGGLVTITRATDTYTIGLPGLVGRILAAPAVHNLNTTLTCTTTVSATAGTVALAFSGDFDSATCDVVVYVDGSA